MTHYLCLCFTLQGAFYAVVVCGIRNLRVIIGPLPLPVCQLIIVSTRMVLWHGVMLITMITLTRFMFICIWRRMRQMNDNLLARIIFREITVLSFFFSFTHIRPSQDLFLCTGIFDTFDINKGTYSGSFVGRQILVVKKYFKKFVRNSQ